MQLRTYFTRFLSLLLAATLFLNLTGCGSTVHAKDLMEDISGKKVPACAPDDSFSSSQMRFALELFQQTVSKTGQTNVLISPLSVTQALAMTANGADGDTLTEMEWVLTGKTADISLTELNGYLHTYADGLPSRKNAKLTLANSIWFREDASLKVKEAFLQTNADFYGAKAYQAPFNSETCKEINDWVCKNTDGMIDKIIDRTEPDSMLYLINALAFDAAWENPYKKEDIQYGTFTSRGGSLQEVEMMYSDEYYYLSDENAVGFLKDYKDRAYRFAALLPEEGMDIYDYIRSLTSEGLQKIIADAKDTPIKAAIPKFSYDYEVTMNQILQEMGMSTAFDASRADFSKMGNSALGNLYIGEVLHKTFISVDELGTKAGAVTSVGIKTMSLRPEVQKEVYLNRPFVYLILDGETNLPVFMGTIVDLAD